MHHRSRRGCISIHAPRTGSDSPSVEIIHFLPRFQSTLPARGATDAQLKRFLRQPISIHAPRTGSDFPALSPRPSAGDFNPRSPHGERPGESSISSQLSQFQSTLPARGATAQLCVLHAPVWDFNPRSPHGERRAQLVRADGHLTISIHAPRTGSDPCWWGSARFRVYFNPRSPHGERRDSALHRRTLRAFQSTLPARGATNHFSHRPRINAFQSTLPARGATF